MCHNAYCTFNLDCHHTWYKLISVTFSFPTQEENILSIGFDLYRTMSEYFHFLIVQLSYILSLLNHGKMLNVHSNLFPPWPSWLGFIFNTPGAFRLFSSVNELKFIHFINILFYEKSNFSKQHFFLDESQSSTSQHLLNANCISFPRFGHWKTSLILVNEILY